MTEFVLWHNPRCSKSRETLALLRARGVEPTIVEYLVTPPDRAEIARVAKALGAPVAGMLRRDEPEFAELGLGGADVDDAARIAAMAAHPRLIQRPILIAGQRAAIGRPPENVLGLLDDAG